MADERLTPILRRLEQPLSPSPAFTADLYAALAPKALEAARRDATLRGRLTGSLGVPRSIGRPTALGWPARIALAALVVLLLVAVMAILAGRRPSGPFVHFTGTGIYRISTDGEVATSSFIASSVAAVSDDGRYAVVNESDSNPATEPAMVDTVTGASQPISSEAGTMTARWSSHDQLAWAMAPRIQTSDGALGDGYATSIELMRPGDPSPRRWPVPDDSPVGELSWSPDGAQLAISTLGLCDGATSSRTYLLDAPTLQAVVVDAPLSGASFQWAPDGRSMMMLGSDACDGSGVSRLMAVDGSNGHALPVIDPFHASPPIWVHGGTALDVSGGLGPEDGSIWQMRPDGSGRHLITRLPHAPDDLQLSPDGTMVVATVRSDGLPAVADYGGWVSAWVFGVDGNEAHRVVDGVWYAWPPSWSPDGRWILVTRSPVGSSAQRNEIKAARTVWIVHPDGTGQQQIVGPGGAVGD